LTLNELFSLDKGMPIVYACTYEVPMPVPKHLLGVKGDECNCGRRMTVRHCPLCGSSRTYGYANEQWHEKVDGTVEKVHLFRCIGCGHQYTDEERKYCCEAPPISQALAMQRIRVLAGADQNEYLRPHDRKAADAIQEILGANTTPENKIKARKDLVFALRHEWADAKFAARTKGVKFDEDVLMFLERRLAEQGQPHLTEEEKEHT